MAESGQVINVKDAAGTVRQVALYTDTGDVPANPLRCGYNGEGRYGATTTDESSVMYGEQYSGWDINDNGTVRHVVCRPVVRVTFSLDPTAAVLTVNGETQRTLLGTVALDFDYGTEVAWEASCDGYVTRTGTFTARADTTVAVELEPDEHLRIVDGDGNVYTGDVHAYAVGDTEAWYGVWVFDLEASGSWSYSRAVTSGSSNVTIYYYNSGDDEWDNLTEGKAYSGDYRLQVQFPVASSSEEKGGTVVFTSESGRCSATIDWLMPAAAATISVSPASLAFAFAGGGATAKVTCGTSWKVASKPSWLDVSPDSGSAGATVTLTAPANRTGSNSARTGTVVFQTADGSASCSLLVSQDYGYMTGGGSWETAAETDHNSEESLTFELNFTGQSAYRGKVARVTLESACWYDKSDTPHGGVTSVYFGAGLPEGHYEETLTADGVVSLPDMSGSISYDCAIRYRGRTGTANGSWTARLVAWDADGNELSDLLLEIRFV